MDIQQKAKRLVRKFARQTRLAWALAVMTEAVLFWLTDYTLISPWIPLIGLPILTGLYFVIFGRLYFARINKILTHELDVDLYRECIAAGNIYYKTGSEWLAISYYGGDYQTTLSLATAKSADPAFNHFRWQYALYLAGVYFDLDNREKLRAVCDEFELAVRVSEKGNKLRAKYPIFRFYRSYVEGDFDACKEYAKSIGTKRAKSPLELLRIDFRTKALILYRSGDTEHAKPLLESIAARAPKLHFAAIARAHLDAMERGEIYSPDPVTLTPDPAYIPPRPSPSVMKRKRILRYVSGVLLVIFLIYFSGICIGLISRSNKLSEYQNRINAAVQAEYEGAVILADFPLKKDGATIETMGICETADGTLMIGYFVIYDGDENVYFIETTELEPGVRYYDYGAVSNHVIGFTLAESKDKIPDDVYYTTEIQKGGKTLYFYIDYIESEQDYLEMFGIA